MSDIRRAEGEKPVMTDKVFGIRFSSLPLDDIADRLVRNPPGREAQMVFTANLDHIVRLRENAAFREAYRRAAIVTADGFPVCLYAQCRGVPLPGRVTGADLFAAIVSR